jgi:integrase/recombinase XerD
LKKKTMPTAERRRRKNWIAKGLKDLRYDQAKALMREVFEEMELQPPHRQRRKKQYFPTADIRLIKSFMADVYRRPHTRLMMGTIIDVMLYTGARIGSVLALRPGDIDIKGKLIRFETAKGDKPYTAAMPDILADILANFLNIRRDADFLFEKESGGDYTVRAIQQNWDRLTAYTGEKTGRDFSGLTLHGIRHTFNTEMAPHMDIRLLAEQNNHSTMVTTEKSYIHQNFLLQQQQINEATLKRLQAEA